MSSSDPSKIYGPLENRLPDDSGDWSQAEAEPSDIFELYVEAQPGQSTAARTAVESLGLDIRSQQDEYLAVDAPADQVVGIASLDSVRHIQERRDPRTHAVADEIHSPIQGEETRYPIGLGVTR